jgi:hypothetical protein
MVIAPPSLRPGIGHYRWLNDAPITDAPNWLIKLLTADKASASQPDDGMGGGTQETGRTYRQI